MDEQRTALLSPTNEPDITETPMLSDEYIDSPSLDPKPKQPFLRRAYSVCVFISLGLAMMTAFNAMISLSDYWNSVYPGRHMEWKATLFFFFINPPLYLAMIFLIRLLPHIVWLAGSVAVTVLSFLLLPAMPLVLPLEVAEYACLLLILTAGAAYSVLGSTVMAVSSIAGPASVQMVMVGQGLAGVVVIGVRIATKLVLTAGIVGHDDGVTISAVLFFLICSAIVSSSVPLYAALLLMDRKDRVHSEAYEPITGEEAEEPAPTSPARALSVWCHRVVAIFRQQFPANLSVCAVYLATSSCFPGMAVALLSGTPALDSTGWFAIIVLLTFMVGDQLGRLLPRIPLFRLGPWAVASLALARLLTIPTFTVLYMLREVVIIAPLPPVLVFVFSLSNGLLSTRAFMQSSEMLPPELTDLGGVVMTMAQVSIIFTGNMLGLLLGYIPQVK
ncbi:Equilibrative nucleoside transporter [Carpediemonas membranifera]|uniref:Equilibrative nucleoside transporter n=1 Tax=Carpediemonas membranifera TaxID=201153 RepID=A0A8J6B3D3_9EUKA|nr:Equilibrative nucleoside transporter [Carpediemonas membranifera]|eukprot:KAG9397470.1 Equilibrative nucleoside transporter [Carpediemonas membranifera]